MTSPRRWAGLHQRCRAFWLTLDKRLRSGLVNDG
ncbi:Uncharacterised protein [Edwardsiella hoshinae]|uniref:Uncharacterized protein n=1 Tax=Edwardsiella hoshinae TaxID=93378 RepID=A0A376DEB9_9GAMM|nr:Uncharacterised protein [Edwardsiella hoshinae]